MEDNEIEFVRAIKRHIAPGTKAGPKHMTALTYEEQ